jgi:hypothetical protein
LVNNNNNNNNNTKELRIGSISVRKPLESGPLERTT